MVMINVKIVIKIPTVRRQQQQHRTDVDVDEMSTAYARLEVIRH